jgi:hypothetical protein
VAKYMSFRMVQSCLTTELSHGKPERWGDSCTWSCFRHSVLTGGGAVGSSADDAPLRDRGPAVVLRLLLPGDFHNVTSTS